MSDKKTITINNALLKGGRRRQQTRKKAKGDAAAKPLIHPDTLRKKFLARIHEHKAKGGEAAVAPAAPAEDEFGNSIAYLQALADENKRNLARQAVAPAPAPTPAPTSVSVELPDSLKRPLELDIVPPPYGVIKGGSKPTYREWNRTHRSPPVISEQTGTSLVVQQPTITSPPPILAIGGNKLTKTIRRVTYDLGKQTGGNQVGVLINDAESRKLLSAGQKELKRTPINEMRAYLMEHNLIRAGSAAPNDVIKQMYQSAVGAGDVTNIDADIFKANAQK